MTRRCGKKQPHKCVAGVVSWGIFQARLRSPACSRSRRIAPEWIWLTRPSLMPSCAAIRFILHPSPGPPLQHRSGSLLSCDVDLQRYVSPDLTHFVGQALTTQEAQFQLLKKIMRGGVLQARPRRYRRPRGEYQLAKHRDRKLSSNNAYEGSIVCFCDIPLGDLPLHMEKYSRFGIAFRKDFLIEQGAMPVVYVPRDGRPSLCHFRSIKADGAPPVNGISSQAVAFDRFWKYYNKVESSLQNLPSARRGLVRDLQKLITFLDVSILSHLKFFDHMLYDDDPDNFYMEREWRATQDVTFGLFDIQRIIVPTRFSQRLRRAFKAYDGEIMFAE